MCTRVILWPSPSPLHPQGGVNICPWWGLDSSASPLCVWVEGNDHLLVLTLTITSPHHYRHPALSHTHFPIFLSEVIQTFTYNFLLCIMHQRAKAKMCVLIQYICVFSGTDESHVIFPTHFSCPAVWKSSNLTNVGRHPGDFRSVRSELVCGHFFLFVFWKELQFQVKE